MFDYFLMFLDVAIIVVFHYGNVLIVAITIGVAVLSLYVKFDVDVVPFCIPCIYG